jgi:hypothetical protein
MTRASAAIFCALLAACGSKSGLVTDSDSRMPGPRPDAAPPDTALPPLGCDGYSTAPEVLVRDETIHPRFVAIRGDTLFFGARHERPLTEPQTGGIFRVSTRGGPHTRVDLAEPFVGGSLLLGPDYLIYHQVRPVRTGAASWSFPVAGVVVELEGARPRVLLTELEEGAGRSPAMAVLADDRLVFGRHRTPPLEMTGSVGLYDIRTGEEMTLLENRDLRRAVGGGGYVYLYFRDEGDGVLMRVDPDLAVTEIARFDNFSCCWPWAADESNLYLNNRGDIEAWPLAGAPFTIAEYDDDRRIFQATVDDRFVYWANSAQIYFVDKRGGPVQTLVDLGTSYVETLATDGCGVFWSAVNAPRVLVQSAP